MSRVRRYCAVTALAQDQNQNQNQKTLRPLGTIKAILRHKFKVKLTVRDSTTGLAAFAKLAPIQQHPSHLVLPEALGPHAQHALPGRVFRKVAMAFVLLAFLVTGDRRPRSIVYLEYGVPRLNGPLTSSKRPCLTRYRPTIRPAAARTLYFSQFYPPRKMTCSASWWLAC